MRSEHQYVTRPDGRKGNAMSNEKTHYCYKCRRDVPAEHEHANRMVLLSTKDCYYTLCIVVGSLLLIAVLGVVLFFMGRSVYDGLQDQNNANAERSELQRCRLERYVITRTGHVPLETVDLDMKKTGTGVKITGDGLVLAANVDPLDVFVATANECNDMLSSQYVGGGEPQRCRIEQYVLADLSPHRQVAALPADLKLGTKNNDDVTEITINGYVTFTDVDTAMLLSRYEACDPQLEP